MYEFVILFLLGLTIFFAYLVACKIIAVNTINRKPLLYINNRTHVQKNLFRNIVEFFRLIITGLGDSESGFYARLSARISAATHLEKQKIETSLICNKISQACILCALFLPPVYFLIFLAFILIVSIVRDRELTSYIIGVLLGMFLMRCCIEMGLYIGDFVQGHDFSSLPGYLYYEFSINHPVMFLINGLFFPLLSLNLSMIFPLVFVPSIILKLNVLDVYIITIGVFLGFVGRSYFVGRVTEGFFSFAYKENFLFYNLNIFWMLCLFAFFYFFSPASLRIVISRDNIMDVSLTIGLVVLLSGFVMGFINHRGFAVVESVFPKTKIHGHKYKYSKSLFKEADLGIKMLMNELRLFSIEQSIYFEKIMRWQQGGTDSDKDLEDIHNYFRERFKEIKSYLTILLHNEEAPLYEENLLMCTKFLDDAKQLGENFHEKLKLLKLLNEDEDKQNLSIFFDHLVQSEDAVYMVFKEALTALELEEIQLVFQIIGNSSAKAKQIQEIQDSYVDTSNDIVTQSHKWIASELTQLYQMDLWLILQLNEILERWCISAPKSYYVLGR